MFNMLSLHPETAAFLIGYTSSPTSLCCTLNLLPPSSLSARPLPPHLFHFSPPPSPAARQPKCRPRSNTHSPGWMPCPCPLWCPVAAHRRLANRDIPDLLRCISSIATFSSIRVSTSNFPLPLEPPNTRLVSPRQRHRTLIRQPCKVPLADRQKCPADGELGSMSLQAAVPTVSYLLLG
jgi:hypothetical protein